MVIKLFCFLVWFGLGKVTLKVTHRTMFYMNLFVISKNYWGFQQEIRDFLLLFLKIKLKVCDSDDCNYSVIIKVYNTIVKMI